MPHFWTFSGINSWSETEQNYVDYVWEQIAGRLSRGPDRRYASRLGTGGHYDRAHNVLGQGAKAKLNSEAATFATRGGGHPVLPLGALRGKTVRVMLVAPKTTTDPPDRTGLHLDVYWSPRDQVPNQALISPDSLTYWRNYVRGDGDVWPVENRHGKGLGRGHDYSGFMVDAPRTMRRVRRRTGPGGKRFRYVWITDGHTAPAPLATLAGWLADGSNDYVFLAHSQGTNIATHFLRRGYAV